MARAVAAAKGTSAGRRGVLPFDGDGTVEVVVMSALVLTLLALAAPSEVDVVVGANRPVTRAAVRGCRDGDKPIDRVAIGTDGVRACAGSCRTARRIVLECDEAVVDLDGTKKRLGRRLVVTAEEGHLRIVATLPLETYVAGVVEAELGAAPDEARKAQAIVARTYARRAMRAPRHDDAHVCDLTHCQVFRPTTKTAPAPGRVLYAKEALAEVYFHGACGGRTLDAEDVWATASKAIVAVDDRRDDGGPWCSEGRIEWRHEIEAQTLTKLLVPIVGRTLDAATLVLRTAGPGRVLVGDERAARAFSAHEVQLALARDRGWGSVESPRFQVTKRGPNVTIAGEGRGHLVGLCQAGAIARAKSGQSAEAILRAYFPKLTIQ